MHPILFRIPLPKMPLKLWWGLRPHRPPSVLGPFGHGAQAWAVR